MLQQHPHYHMYLQWLRGFLSTCINLLEIAFCVEIIIDRKFTVKKNSRAYLHVKQRKRKKINIWRTSCDDWELRRFIQIM